MRYLFTLLLLGMTSFGFCQTNNDELLLQAKDQYNQGAYENSIKLLKSINGKKNTREITDHLMILNHNKLLSLGDYPSYDLIKKVRNLSNKFCENYPKSKYIHEVKRVLQEMNVYPATEQEYQIKSVEELYRKKIEKQKRLLEKIKNNYQEGKYVQALTAIKIARDSGYNESPVQFYDLMIKNKKFDQNALKTFQEVESIREFARSIISLEETSSPKLSSTELNDIKKIIGALPKSFDEFQKNEEAKKAAALAILMQQKFTKIASEYESKDYVAVISTINDFTEESLDRLKVSYYQGMSRYHQFKLQYNFEFSELLLVRSNLQAYLNAYSSDHLTYRNDISAALTDLNKNFPNSQYAYDALLKKREKEQLTAIRRAKRKMFTNLGYEYGEMAPIGLRIETGGGFIGFFTILRYGLKTNNQLEEYYYNTGHSQPNKTELIIGPNLKVSKWLLLNIGGGYGIYSHLYRNDYASQSGYKKSGYFAGYGGLTLRVGESMNFVGGVSLMDIDNQISKSKFKKPEFTVGITFNFRK